MKQERSIEYQTRAMKLLNCFTLNNNVYKQLVTAFINYLKCLNNGTINSSKSNTFQIYPFLYDFKHIYTRTKAKPTLNPFPCTDKNPTQPTTNRKTETDFREDVNTADALHRCIRLTECLWA